MRTCVTVDTILTFPFCMDTTSMWAYRHRPTEHSAIGSPTTATKD